jgi:predicted helicase
MEYGYIYIRSHESYDKYNVYKLGKTTNIVDRDFQYATNEVARGKFILVLRMNKSKIDLIEKVLQSKFIKYNIKFDGGIEFYNRSIMNELVSFLQTLNFEFKILSSTEINKLTRKVRIINRFKNIVQKLTQRKQEIVPYNYQQNVLDKINDFYSRHDIGKIIWACGTGKTILSIFIAKLLHCNLVLYGVPTRYLQQQIGNEILKLFPNKSNILFVGGNEYSHIKSTTKKSVIMNFIRKETNECKFIITTYTSCLLLMNQPEIFDLKIGDEAHHLVGIEGGKTYECFHKIKSYKTLFMTATEKVIDSNEPNITYSMDDENIFGNYIDTKTIYWAIENRKITDYNLLILKNTEEQIDEIIRHLKLKVSNKELFISAFMTLKAIETYKDLTHVLIYANTTDNSELIKIYVNEILNLNILHIKSNEIYNNALHSNLAVDMKTELELFKNSKYGIISCVYIFGEGFDLPKLNGVTFSENMTSEIRIVQSALRPNRLEKNNPTKKAYIIIPIIDTDDLCESNESFSKCKKVITKIRNVDENIERKIVVGSIQNHKNKTTTTTEINDYKIDYDDNELEKIKIKLRHSKLLLSNNSEEQNEYNYIKTINKKLNIQTKEQYFEMKRYHRMFIDNPEDYFKIKGVWKGWYDFLNFDTSIFIQSKEEWIKFCRSHKIKSVNNYLEACLNFVCLPKNPALFYKNFTSISHELHFNVRNRK